MRILMLILCFVLAADRAACQQPLFSVQPPDKTTQEANAAWDSSYVRLYSKGVAQFAKGNFSGAENIFRKAFEMRPAEEAARYLYYSLLYQGNDLEAADFKQRYPDYTFAISLFRKGLESIYTDLGPRISANNNADNILYGDAGAFCRLSGRTRLWQSLTYLQQNEDLGHFKQYEYFGSLITYIGHGWYVQPSLHYDYVPYTFIVQQANNVSYTATYRAGRDDTIVYKTKAVQAVTITTPGATQFFNFSLPLSKRMGAFAFEAEPSVHWIPGSSTIHVAYTSAGTTDSFKNNRYEGSKPFTETGGSNGDTAYSDFTVQAGAAVSYRLPIPGEPLSVRAAAWYLWDDKGSAAPAYHVSAVLRWRKNLRVYGSWLNKGSLPMSLRTEGQYFNFNDPVKTRLNISFQIFPLRHFSPVITYQYERDMRLQDDAPLIYHAVYLSLKYSL